MSWWPLGYKQGKNYYVSLAGNDANDGLTPATPWLTCSKVNATTFNPGDTVNFNGGDNFSGTLTFAWNTNIPFSVAALPFTVQSYGTGQATITANNPGVASGGQGPRSWCIKCDGVNGFVVNNLNITGSGYTTPTQYGVYSTNSSTLVNFNVTVKNCNISGFAIPPTGAVADFAIEININGFPPSGGHPGTDGVLILNNNLFGTAGVSSPDDIGTGGFGFALNLFNITQQGNLIYNIGQRTNAGGGGIDCSFSGGLVQYNIVHDVGTNNTNVSGGPIGIGTFQAAGVIIQFNEVYNIQPAPYLGRGSDWDAFDLDGATSNSIVQYNYAHHCFGAGYLCFFEKVGPLVWDNNHVRYNISENCNIFFISLQLGTINFGGFAGTGSRVYCYNNTCWAVNPAPPLHLPCGLMIGGNVPTASVVANNIFFIGGNQNGKCILIDCSGISGAALPTPNITFAANCWHTFSGVSSWYQVGPGRPVYTTLATWQAAVSSDVGAIIANPVFAGTGGTGGTLTWTPSTQSTWPPEGDPSVYQLTPGSPCIGTGVDLTQAPFNLNVGVRDYFGNSIPHGVGTGYNIGADGAPHP